MSSRVSGQASPSKLIEMKSDGWNWDGKSCAKFAQPCLAGRVSTVGVGRL